MSRTTADLISELKTEAANFTTLQLVVAFAEFCEFVDADDPQSLSILNGAIGRGGAPIGFIGATIEPRRVEICSRCLQEYRGDSWAHDVLERVATEKGKWTQSFINAPQGPSA